MTQRAPQDNWTVEQRTPNCPGTIITIMRVLTGADVEMAWLPHQGSDVGGGGGGPEGHQLDILDGAKWRQ